MITPRRSGCPRVRRLDAEEKSRWPLTQGYAEGVHDHDVPLLTWRGRVRTPIRGNRRHDGCGVPKEGKPDQHWETVYRANVVRVHRDMLDTVRKRAEADEITGGV